MTRRLTVDRVTHAVAIHDVLSASRGETICFHGSLHFAPDLKVESDLAGARIVASDPGSGTALTVQFAAEHLSGFDRFSGQEDPIRGWGMSTEGFGPVQTVVYDVCGSGPVDLVLSWSRGQ